MRSLARTITAGIVSTIATLGLAGSARAAQATDPPEERRIVISGLVGVMRPSDADMRTLYGGSQTWIGLDCEVQVRPALAIFLGGRFSERRGSTAVLPPQVFEESHALELTNRFLQMGLAVTKRPGSARLRWIGGTGLAIGSYNERWHEVSEPIQGPSVGVVGFGGAHYAATTRVGLVTRVEWSFLKARGGSSADRTPDLGGVMLAVGMSAAF